MAIIPPLPWSGGVDRTRTSVESNPATAYSMKNMRITEQGIKRVRGGLRHYHRAANGTPYGIDGSSGLVAIAHTGVRALIPYQYGEAYRLLGILKTGMHYRTIGGYKRVGNSLVITKPTDTLQFGSSVLITALSSNAINARKSASMYRWDGASDVALVTGAPSVRYMRTHYNRVIGAGSYQEPTLWYACAPGNVDEWAPDYAEDPDGSGFIAEVPGNHSITGISPSHYGGFYLSTTDAIHFISGRSPSEFQANPTLIANGLGNFGHRTLMNVRGSILGWNHSGCYALTDTDRSGQRTTTEIGSPINKVFRDLVRRVPDLFFSIDNFADGEYVTFMPHIEDPTSTVAIVYNYRAGQWYWYEIADNIYSACMWDYGHDPVMLLGGGNSFVAYLQNGQLTDYEDTTFETDFEVLLETHRMMLGNQDNEASVRAIGIMLQDNLSRPITVNYWLDRDNDNDISRTTKLLPNPAGRPTLNNNFSLGSSRLAAQEDAVIVKSYEAGEGRYGQLRIKMDASDLGDLKMHGLFFQTNDSGGGPVR